MKTPPSFFAPGPLVEGRLVRLSEQERRHARARRVRAGSPVRLIDGSGGAAAGTVEELSRTGFAVRIGRLESLLETDAVVTVLAPVLRFSRLAWLVEKATELGAHRIVLVATSRAQGNRAGAAAKEAPRLARLAREAAKQCGRASFPAIEGPIDFSAALGFPAECRLILDPGGDAFPESIPDARAAVWAGPEGGFRAEERDAAVRAGWRAARLPGSILRAETAVLAALALAGRAIDSVARRKHNTPIHQQLREEVPDGI